MPMQLRAVAIAAGVLAVAVLAFFLLSGRGSDIPIINTVLKPKTCPLSGREPKNEKLLDRPAVAVKVENNPAAYPLSGLEKAEIVYEEPVEGGLTRFMAMYHCTDAAKVGPVRSSRTVDPAIMTPTTRILAAAGGNAIVRKALDKGNVVLIDEGGSNGALRRVARPGISSEHTLYGDTVKLRRVGSKRFDRPPSRESYEFGDLDGKSKKASTVTITFSGALTVTYEWKHGRWFRSDDGEPLVAESGKQIAVDNVLIEEHDVNFSKTIVDVAGNPSVEIADVTGRGRAVLFRDGRAIRGRWIRDSVKDAVHFETTDGDEMSLHEGTTWVELVPSPRGELKGSFSFAR
jgi:Protein of unknown function (DUF3048) N-terminal domain/Protein of unknown function (DUF3048) C-terminal domain